MSFQNPYVLFALIAALVPLAIHLYSRWSTDDITRRAVEMLNVNRFTHWKRRLEPWLLDFGWSLVMVLIVVALAGPVVRTPLFASPEPPRSWQTIVLIDCSESTRIDAVKAWANEFFAAMQPGDRVAVFAVVDGDLVPLLGTPQSDRHFARSSIVLLPKPRGVDNWPKPVAAVTRVQAEWPGEWEILAIPGECWRAEQQLAVRQSGATPIPAMPHVWVANVGQTRTSEWGGGIHKPAGVEAVSSVDELRERRGRGPPSRGVGGLVLLVAVALVGVQLAYMRWSRRSPSRS